MASELIKVTTKCRACGQPMHLWQDSSGSGWMHDKLIDEYNCHRAGGDDGPAQTLAEHTAVAIERILGA